MTGWRVVRFALVDGIYLPRLTATKPITWDLQEALAWCRENGYTVHEWPGGARAWLGEAQPVRTMKSACRLLENAPESWPVETLDLMYDG